VPQVKKSQLLPQIKEEVSGEQKNWSGAFQGFPNVQSSKRLAYNSAELKFGKNDIPSNDQSNI
jgi:hypothetical protein